VLLPSHNIDCDDLDSDEEELTTTEKPAKTPSGPSLWLLGIGGLFLNALVTSSIVAYQQQQHKQKPTEQSLDIVDGWGPLTLRGLSHVSINVPDVDEAIEFYHRVLGYEVMQAGPLWGAFDLRGLDNENFCKDAGFMDGKCKLDCVWLKHPHININLELFSYSEPANKNYLLEEELPRTHDIGGVKHIAYAVEDADKAFQNLKSQPDVQFISSDPDYKPVRMDPFPFTFFYWRDPYGVQWECEEGDKIITRQISGLSRMMDEYIEFK
jgi:catechol 2,3-dioxygenase-like lactoylglutathione lyase family enzyme